MKENSSMTSDWNADYFDKLLPTAVIQCVIFLIGLIGNLIVLTVYFFKMKENRDDRYFIPILAVFDLIASTVASVFYVLESFYFVDFPSSELCKGLFFGMTFSSGLSALLLIAIAVQRYLKICNSHGQQMDETKRKIFLSSIIIFSIVYACPVVLFSGNKQVSGVFRGRNVTGWTCFTGAGKYPDYEAIYYYIMFFLMLVNILTVGALYVPIGIKIYRHTKLTDRRRSSVDFDSTQFDSVSENKPSDDRRVKSPRSKTFKKSKINFNNMFLTIIVCYLVSYTPTCIFLVISKLDPDLWYNISTFEMFFYFTLQRLYVINHVVNPIIYSYFDFKFRMNVAEMCKCK